MKITEKTPRKHVDLGQILNGSVLFQPQPCIYYLLDINNEVVYIGQAINLQARLLEHRCAGIDFVRFRYHTCEASDLNRLEQEAIARLKPTGSKPLTNRSTSGHLSKQLICLKHNMTPVAFERLREAFNLQPVSKFGNAKYYKPEDVEAWVRQFKRLVLLGKHVLQVTPTYLAVGISTRTKLIQLYTKR